MLKKSKLVLVVGFNTRPLVYSLYKAGYEVYAVDFFGDLDLHPYVKKSLIITKELGSSYDLIKDYYREYLVKFTIDMLKKYPEIDYLLIGSGLDDAFEDREEILENINNVSSNIIDVNNDVSTIKLARDINNIYRWLTSKGHGVPRTISYQEYKKFKDIFQFPFILKKKMGSGGINVIKIEDENQLSFNIKMQKNKGFIPSHWLIQEYIDGIPISCTTISNGRECEIISINHQIIGLNFLNPPKEFMYCGNVVPANLFKKDEILISEISKILANELGLKGINGFDFVLKNHYPYLMEINPRIPGSIRASEAALDLNLLDLHINSFNASKWEYIKNFIKTIKPKSFATKLIVFAPKEIDISSLIKINNLEHVHDKTEPSENVSKGEPLCTVLLKGRNFSESYFRALKIVDAIKSIIDEKDK
ncbi:MAG: ATP-grasp domain-containing protein [Promethearchaeota archaeon]